MPFFFDLSSLVPVVERNPFEPVVVPDVLPDASVPGVPLNGMVAGMATEAVAPKAAELAAPDEEVPAEPIVDTGLPIPAHYDFDMMRAMVQDPFRLFVYWQLKDSPFDRLNRMFPASEVSSFQTVLKLIDETTNIAVFFNAAYAREYWFSVFPDRSYRVELGVRSPRYGFIKLLSSQTARTPRGGPSDQAAPEEEYKIAADDYLEVLRESHMVPDRAHNLFGTIDGLLPGTDAAPAGARNAVWESLPASFRRLMHVIADMQAGREYDRWWERLKQEDLTGMVQEFLATISRMGDGELGYMLLLRYLPELLRRAITDEARNEASPESNPELPEWNVERRKVEMLIDKPITLYLAERLGQVASEMNQRSPSDNAPQDSAGHQPDAPPQPGLPTGSIAHGQWLPSLNL
ncbi:MAG: DUF4912 domain-containing protein [Acidobacteriota bacterium]